MRLVTYTLMMASVTGIGHALLAFRFEPLPNGLLEGVVAPGTTIGGAAVLLGMWTAGIASTVGGTVGLFWLTWQFWRDWQLFRRKRSPRVTGPASQ
ncbi:hypothetical protein QMO56_18450 [Roseomonas sp. E05]|uniref:hypothetical protein n=1 Tax=Roseomonas sp. E05 TaxID=3046310 RepID=UPI0024BAD409|nr:hypothetical protein [Roseomonas sp. E05]MDJ0390094.1 hypothetical protein [Roseomonas sp. E05]